MIILNVNFLKIKMEVQLMVARINNGYLIHYYIPSFPLSNVSFQVDFITKSSLFYLHREVYEMYRRNYTYVKFAKFPGHLFGYRGIIKNEEIVTFPGI